MSSHLLTSRSDAYHYLQHLLPVCCTDSPLLALHRLIQREASFQEGTPNVDIDRPFTKETIVKGCVDKAGGRGKTEKGGGRVCGDGEGVRRRTGARVCALSDADPRLAGHSIIRLGPTITHRRLFKFYRHLESPPRLPRFSLVPHRALSVSLPSIPRSPPPFLPLSLPSQPSLHPPLPPTTLHSLPF